MRDRSLKTLAFIIKTQNYGESDKILTLFTREMGKVKSIAKGAKNSKKRFLNCLEHFYLIETILLSKKEDHGLYLMDSARLVTDYSNVHKNYNILKRTSLIMDLISNWTAENDPNPELFEAINWIMDMINSEKAQIRHIIFFNVILLKLTGIFPDIKTCERCGSNILKEGAWCENIYSGRFLCNKCRDSSSKFHLSPGTIKTFNFILEQRFERLNILHLNSKISQEAMSFLRIFNSNYFDRCDLYEN